MTIQEILDRIELVSIESNYWFIRTEYGKLFDDFIHGNYVAVGWDYLTLYELNNVKEDVVKNKIALHDKIDLNNINSKIKVSTEYNKLKTFINMKVGDIVVIPSRNSDRLAFGRIVDNTAYEDYEAKEYIKRKKIEWLETKNIDDLDSIFYQVKSNQHTISNIDRFAPYIDRVVGNLYSKGDNTHFVLNIEKTEEINFDELKTLMDNIKVLMININKELGFNEDVDNFYIKINLQSPGALELIKKKSKSLAIFAYLMYLSSCQSLDKEKDVKIKNIIEDNRKVLSSTQSVIDTLKVNTFELTKPFNNGK